MRIALTASLLVLSVTACAGQEGAGYDDPFAYCAAVQTADTPGPPYRGAKVPDGVVQGLIAAGVLSSSAPLKAVKPGIEWRCMAGRVYACTVGANLPCSAKADERRQPSPATTDYCRENAEADAVPAYVTGRATVYAWCCLNGRPAIVRQVASPDARGYLSDIWTELARP